MGCEPAVFSDDDRRDKSKPLPFGAVGPCAQWMSGASRGECTRQRPLNSHQPSIDRPHLQYPARKLKRSDYCRAPGLQHGGNPPISFQLICLGSTPCKANCPCTSAFGVERGPGAGVGVSPPRCRTAAAGCTAVSRPALRRAIGTRSSTAATPPARPPAGARSLRSCGP